jgi:hypothetical protein
MENNTLINPGFRPGGKPIVKKQGGVQSALNKERIIIMENNTPINPGFRPGEKPVVKKQGGVQSDLNSDIPQDPGFKFTGLVEQKSPSGRVR